jgi:hypothetical protein
MLSWSELFFLRIHGGELNYDIIEFNQITKHNKITYLQSI